MSGYGSDYERDEKYHINLAKENSRTSLKFELSIQIIKLPQEFFKDLSFLTEINLENNKIEKLNKHLFKNLSSLEIINLSSNQIKHLPKTIFKDLKSLRVIYVKGNQIVHLKEGVFKDLTNLTSVEFGSNRIEYLAENLFSGLSSLKDIKMERNRIVKLHKNLFKNANTSNKLFLGFSNNQIDFLDENIFNNCSGLDQIHFDKNRIKKLSSNIFKGLKFLEIVDFSDNLIESLPKSIFEDLPRLLVTKFSNNRINFLDIKEIPRQLWNISFTNNFDINDFDITFESCFTFNDKNFWGHNETQRNTYYNWIKCYLKFENDHFWVLSKEIEEKYSSLIEEPSKEQAISSYKINYASNVDNIFYMVKNGNERLFRNRVCSIYLNKMATTSKNLFYSNPNVTKNCLNDKLFLQRLTQLDDLKWSVLDFFIFLPKYIFANQELINFHRYIINRLQQNLFIVNLEYTFYTSDIMEAFFERDDEYLVDLFFPKKSLQSFISNEEKEKEKSHLKEIFKYINASMLWDFFLNINYSKCLEIAINNNSENMAIYLLILLKFTFKKEKIIIENIDKFKNISLFNELFMNKYLIEIFSKEWNDFIKMLLDFSTDKDDKFDFLKFTKENDLENRIKLFSTCRGSKVTSLPLNSSQEQSKATKSSICCYPCNDDETKNIIIEAPKQILTLINESKQKDFLRHSTTKKLLHEKWKLLPTYLYHSKLIIYILFVIFYSTNIELYNQKNDGNNLAEASKWISVCLTCLFLSIELIEVIYSILSKKILLYLTSIKNLIEFINYPLCLVALLLPSDDAYYFSVKSALFSITILSSYMILLISLDKLAEIGPYVNVFGNIITRSLRLIAIIFICLIGFLLSFRNRSINFEKYSGATDVNEFGLMKQFDGSFIFGLFKILVMFTGGLVTELMGLEDINKDNFVNHIVYALFIFIMVILFLNVFTGISIDAVSELIENSEAENIANKIEYVDKIQLIMTNSNSKFLFLVRKILISLETLIRKIYSYKINSVVSLCEQNIWQKLISKSKNYCKECYKKFRSSKDSRKKKSDELTKKIDELNKLIWEIKSESNHILSKVETISKRQTQMEANLEVVRESSEMKKHHVEKHTKSAAAVASTPTNNT